MAVENLTQENVESTEKFNTWQFSKSNFLLLIWCTQSIIYQITE